LRSPNQKINIPEKVPLASNAIKKKKLPESDLFGAEILKNSKSKSISKESEIKHQEEKVIETKMTAPLPELTSTDLIKAWDDACRVMKNNGKKQSEVCYLTIKKVLKLKSRSCAALFQTRLN